MEKPKAKPERPLLQVSDLYVRDDRELEKVSGLSLSVRAGEIVALAGVDGNGQQELVEAITGIRAPESGAVVIDGREIAGEGVRAATNAGVAHIAEDRQLRGLVLPFTLTENLAMREYRKPAFSARGWLRLSYWKDLAKRLLRRIRCPGRRTGHVCGGTLGRQPAEGRIAREIASDPQVLVAHQPTRGLDIGAIEFVHRRLIEERDKGRGVLLVSLEYEEVKALADRILVIYEGKIVGEFPPDASEEELGIAMTGGTAEAAEVAS